METTQERHTTNSIAEQELFLPQSSGSHEPSQHNHNYSGQQPRQRWYDDINNNNNGGESPTVQAGSGVPAVNIIPATPTTVRSDSVRSNASWRADHGDQKQMPGALPEVEEEDNIYDPPNAAPPPPPVEHKSAAQETPSEYEPENSPEESLKQEHEYIVSPMSDAAVLHHDTGYSRSNGHSVSIDGLTSYDAPIPYEEPVKYNGPTSQHDHGKATEFNSYHEQQPPLPDKGKAVGASPDHEERPPLPGPRPVSSEIPDFYAQEHGFGVDPKIQEQEDRDYAMALALQEEEEEQAPPLPQRPPKPATDWDSKGPLSSNPFSPEDEDRAFAQRLQEEEEGGPAPPLPARPHPQAVAALLAEHQEPPPFTRTPSIEGIMPPPKRQGSDFGTDDPSNPIHYTRDPHKLITYLVPFPKPWLGAKAPSDIMPTRFLIYTPPPPPLQPPPEGVKEGVSHKIQRKWQTEVRQAKMSEAKTTSWAGFKAKCTRGVDKAMQYTTTSNLDYLARVTPPPKPPSSLARRLSFKSKDKKEKKGRTSESDDKEKEVEEKKGETVEGTVDVDKRQDDEKKEFEEENTDEKAREEKMAEDRGLHDDSDSKGKEKEDRDELLEDDPAHTSHETKKTVGVEEIVFVYSPSMNMTPEAMREEFINTMMRTKSKAQRDAIIATGLLPISLAIDTVMIAVSGLFEVNAVWAYFTIKGSKTARSVTKRLASSSKKPETIDPEKSEHEMEKEDKLRLSFKPSTRIDLLTRYLEAECHRVDSRLFPRYTSSPTEIECLEAIGWSPALTRGQKNWEDEAWEVNDVKDDLRVVFHKAAKEWRKWCNRYEKNPEKSMSK
ncbi:hypothetical protein CCHL11_00728 [Colletotrichum chlorophyti]|uniref:Secreted protein n=1 Tax=Colletotrichum chlorophyti TaxID=708187 RepID=A0A1Q8S4Q2_9PEZI|nr:hypothetical protein CCHL11_00728 [Colletotrichum chlorophyti]